MFNPQEQSRIFWEILIWNRYRGEAVVIVLIIHYTRIDTIFTTKYSLYSLRKLLFVWSSNYQVQLATHVYFYIFQSLFAIGKAPKYPKLTSPLPTSIAKNFKLFVICLATAGSSTPQQLRAIIKTLLIVFPSYFPHSLSPFPNRLLFSHTTPLALYPHTKNFFHHYSLLVQKLITFCTVHFLFLLPSLQFWLPVLADLFEISLQVSLFLFDVFLQPPLPLKVLTILHLPCSKVRLSASLATLFKNAAGIRQVNAEK